MYIYIYICSNLGTTFSSTCLLLSQTPIAMMAFRFALVLFTSGLLLIEGPPASSCKSWWIKPCGGAPPTRKTTKEIVNAPLLDQLLNSLSQVGCTKVSSLAKAAVLPISLSLQAFAKHVGGSSRAHVERSLQNWAQKQTWIDFLPEPFDFKIHVEDLGGNRGGVFAQEAGPITAMHSCMLPHEVISSLWKHAPDVFEHLLGDASTLKAFWQAAATADDEWYREHPVILGGAPPEVCIPIGLHGAMQVCMVASRCWLSPGTPSLMYFPRWTAASCLRC